MSPLPCSGGRGLGGRFDLFLQNTTQKGSQKGLDIGRNGFFNRLQAADPSMFLVGTVLSGSTA